MFMAFPGCLFGKIRPGDVGYSMAFDGQGVLFDDAVSDY
jgi:hypothetical protein